MLVLVLLPLAALVALAEDPVPATQTWGGHQVSIATRKVPLLGSIETRQDVWMVGEVTDGPDGPVIVETACRIDLKSTAGLELVFAPAAVRELPKPTIAWKAAADGALAASWTNGWGHTDIDGNGEPGFNVGVKVAVCSGSLEIASNTRFDGTARRADGGIDGRVDMVIDREILKASNACLGLVQKVSKDAVKASFRWRPVDAGATCESLAAAGWPVTADPL